MPPLLFLSWLLFCHLHWREKVYNVYKTANTYAKKLARPSKLTKPELPEGVKQCLRDLEISSCVAMSWILQ
jgi:hypothetical protein